MRGFVLKVRRGEGPFYGRLHKLARAMRSASLPVPGFLLPLARGLFALQQSFMELLRWSWSYFWVGPLFRGRCKTMGKRVSVARMPYIIGDTEIHVGDDVNFFGKFDVFSGRLFDNPRLVIGDRTDVGPGVAIVCNKEIVIENDVNIATGVRFMDSDAHPRDTMDRIADLPPRPEEVKPVRVGRYCWIGQNSFILKGVTIGEGAIIGVNSVVATDIPAYTVAMGNPARVVVKLTPPPEYAAATAPTSKA